VNCDILKRCWGYEHLLIRDPQLPYSAKLLAFNFNDLGERIDIPWHSHFDKTETMIPLEGSFYITLLIDGQEKEQLLSTEAWESKVTIPRGTWHKIRCLSKTGVILEVSTTDREEDNYLAEKCDP
jgi:mannose-6-phosphate isomerase-like protein (cupin superfamily)